MTTKEELEVAKIQDTVKTRPPRVSPLAKVLNLSMEEIFKEKVWVPTVNNQEPAPATNLKRIFQASMNRDKSVARHDQGGPPDRRRVRWHAMVDYLSEFVGKYNTLNRDLLDQLSTIKADLEFEKIERRSMTMVLIALVTRCINYEDLIRELLKTAPKELQEKSSKLMLGELNVSMLVDIAEILAKDANSEHHSGTEFINEEYPFLNVIIAMIKDNM